jgi:hypothetical protein
VIGFLEMSSEGLVKTKKAVDIYFNVLLYIIDLHLGYRRSRDRNASIGDNDINLIKSQSSQLFHRGGRVSPGCCINLSGARDCQLLVVNVRGQTRALYKSQCQ